MADIGALPPPRADSPSTPRSPLAEQEQGPSPLAEQEQGPPPPRARQLSLSLAPLPVRSPPSCGQPLNQSTCASFETECLIPQGFMEDSPDINPLFGGYMEYSAFNVDAVDEMEYLVDNMEYSASDADAVDEMEDNGQPFLGKEFKSEKDAYEFYNAYAGKIGFSIRRDSNTKTKDGLSSFRMVCYKEGFSKRQKRERIELGSASIQRTPKKEFSSRRTGCKALMRVRKFGTGLWKVSVFNDEHNHALLTSPAKKRALRSLKGISQEEKDLIAELRAQNMGTAQIFEFLAKRAGGRNNIRYKKKDVRNEVTRENKKLRGVDVGTTIAYFQTKQVEDAEFFYAIEADDDGAVKNMFWVDGRARRAFQEFGDVVTFDTTYNTNLYSMPLAPFIGVNHHWNSIFFGCALLRNEKATSFTWLFRTWLKAMYNKAPGAIITDQDPAMKVAIAEVFPGTVHRCCQWHVMRKAREHLGVLYGQNPAFQNDLLTVINRSLTVSDFECSWGKMITKHYLESNKHLELMYAKRTEWVPAYFRGIFFCDMSTSQRSESMNAMLKLWVSSNTSIYQFVLQFEKMVDDIWQKESDEDTISINEIPHLWSRMLIEVDAREMYTRRIFSRFKEVVKESTNGFVTEVERDAVYTVDIDFHTTIANWVSESHTVKVEKESQSVSCSCKAFEFEGILCEHAIKVMHHVKIQNLPSKYILKRWCKGANARSKKLASERCMDLGESNELEALRLATIRSAFNDLGKLASKSSVAYRFVLPKIEELKQSILPMVEKAGISNDAEKCSAMVMITGGEEELTPTYHDPPLSQCKGRKKKPQRFKPVVETSVKKRRTCGYCSQQAGHNARSCPKRMRDVERSSRSKLRFDDDDIDKDYIEDDIDDEDNIENEEDEDE